VKHSCFWKISLKTLAVAILLLPMLPAMAGIEAIVYQNECMGCHIGPTKDGSVTGPPLGGLSEQYILRQLEGFKYGWRGAGHPAARTMSQAISSYSDQELREIASWASKIKSERHFDYKLGRGNSGYELYRDKCKGCHDSAIGRRMTGSPRLKNLDVDYIVRQLHFFDEQLREFKQPTKHQLKMQSVVQTLTDDEFEVLTRFIIGGSLDKREIHSE